VVEGAPIRAVTALEATAVAEAATLTVAVGQRTIAQATIVLVQVLVLTMAGEAAVLFDHMRAVVLSLVSVHGRTRCKNGMPGLM